VGFIKKTCADIGTFLGYTVIVGLSPVYGIGDYLLNVFIVEGGKFLVTGLEIEDLTQTSEIAYTGTEDIALLKP